MNNKVIIIGINHFNTLGLIRSFGIHQINPYVLIINPDSVANYCLKSKYVKGHIVVKTYDEAFEFLCANFENETTKPVIIPASDGAIYMLDNSYNKLSDKYILPHINHKQGEIAKLMNKLNQSIWAESLEIPTAQTFLLDFKGNEWMEQEYPMPCIVKPVLSHEGKKSEIRKCNTKDPPMLIASATR